MNNQNNQGQAAGGQVAAGVQAPGGAAQAMQVGQGDGPAAGMGISNNIIVSTIDAFCGTSGTKPSVEEFIRSVENASGLAGWNEVTTVSVAMCKLKGIALEFVQIQGRPANWNAFKNLLRNRFSAPTNELSAFSKLVACQQKENESVAEFTQRLQLLHSQTLPAAGDQEAPDNQLLFKFFLAGLNQSLKASVLQHNPQNFAQALEWAQYSEGCELLMNTKRTNRAFQISYEPPQLDINPNPPRTAQERNFQQKSNSNPIECYYCHNLGHVARHCYAKQRDMAQGSAAYHKPLPPPNHYSQNLCYQGNPRFSQNANTQTTRSSIFGNQIQLSDRNFRENSQWL